MTSHGRQSGKSPVCTFLSVISIRNIVCVWPELPDILRHQIEGTRSEKVLKVLLAMLLLFHHWMSVCPNRDKWVPLWRYNSAASYCIHIWFLLSQSVFLSLSSLITPLPRHHTIGPRSRTFWHAHQWEERIFRYHYLSWKIWKKKHIWENFKKGKKIKEEATCIPTSAVSQHLWVAAPPQLKEYFSTIATSLCIYYTDVSRMFLCVQIAILLCITSMHGFQMHPLWSHV